MSLAFLTALVNTLVFYIRCHRVGQTRPVRIIRLISCDTVEQVMQQRAERKLQLEKDMTDNGLDANATVKDLMTTYLNEVE